MAGQGSLLADLPRGDPDREADEFSPPSAIFARPQAVRAAKSLEYQPGKMFLGVIDGAVVERQDNGGAVHRHIVGGHAVGIADDRHIVTIAGTRAGKGRAVIVPNMLHYPGSVLATDPKGELARITARRRAKGLKQRVHVLDPFGLADGPASAFRASFNPISAMRPDSLIEDAALIADALVVISDRDPFWDESARNLIEGVILNVATAGPPFAEPRSLVTVRRLIGQGALGPDGKRDMDALEALMRTEEHPVIQSAAADFFDRPERERGSVLSSARRHLKFLDYPEIQGVVERHSFGLEELKRKPTTIYLCLPARHMGTCSRWLRLFVNLTLQAMEREQGPPAGGVPLLCCLDEFATLGHMRQVEDAAGQIAGFGVKLWPIVQDLGQLKALYKDRWETFMGNAGVLQFFGNSDLTTLEWISKRCGRAAIRSRRDSPVTRRQVAEGASGQSWGTEVYDLIGPDEAARFFGRDDPQLRQLIVFAGRRPPVILQRAYYDTHDLFRGQFDHAAQAGV